MAKPKPLSGCAAGSFIFDQPFWSPRFGRWPSSNPDKKLTVDWLLAAFAETENPAIVATTQNTGRLIRAENGLEVAIRLIEQRKAAFTLKNPIL